MKGLFEFLAMFSIGHLIDLIWSIVKGHTTRWYIGLIDGVRSMYFVAIVTTACLLLLVTGFLLLHLALFLYLPWQMNDKIILLIVLGGVYLITPMFLIGWLSSRRYWLKISGAQKMLDGVSGKK